MASTRALHLVLFCAVLSIYNQMIPSSFISASTLLLHVPFGLLGFLYPGGVHFNTLFAYLLFPVLSTCPMYLHFLFFISAMMLPTPVLSASSPFDINSGHLMLTILLRHIPSNPRALLSNCHFVSHVSVQFNSTDLILLTYNLIFVLIEILLLFQMFLSFF